jgi:hypothetical protein
MSESHLSPIAARFTVHQSTVSLAVRGKTWRHVTEGLDV